MIETTATGTTANLPPPAETKAERQLVERLNRIRNLTPGRQRVWKLDHIAMLLEMDADDEPNPEFASQLRDSATFIRRLEWDLGELRDAVRGDTRRAISNRNDPTQWKGPRP